VPRLGRNQRKHWLDKFGEQLKIAVVEAATRSLRNGTGQVPT
jgi:hypothetical protein